MQIDLHVHSNISACSVLSLEDIVALAARQGLDGVCITDHDTMAAARLVREGVQACGVVVVVGMEYATPQGDFLLFGPFEGLAPGLNAVQVLDRVRAMGGAAVAAHPFRAARPVDETLVRSGRVCCVEAFNGRNAPGENLPVARWVERYGVGCVAGSDAHLPDEIGIAPTRFLTPVSSRAQLIEALREGSYESVVPQALPAA